MLGEDFLCDVINGGTSDIEDDPAQSGGVPDQPRYENRIPSFTGANRERW